MAIKSTLKTPKVLGTVTNGNAAVFGDDEGRTIVDGGTPGGSGITQLTGDVTAGPGSGSQAATIPNDTVTDAKLRNSGACSVIGRSANSAGDPADISAASNDVVLARASDVIAFGKVALAAMVSGQLPATNAGNPEVRAALTAPINGDYSWINQGASSIVDETDSVVLVGGATGSGANLACRVKTAPATPYVITAYLIPLILEKNFNSYGIMFRASGTGRIAVCDVLQGQIIRSTKFTSATAFSADYVTYPVEWPIRWIRIADDGVNRICSISMDGVYWLDVHSVARTDFLTADQVGFHVSTENVATPNFAPILRVQSWAES